MMMNRGACCVAKNLIKKNIFTIWLGSRGPEAEKELYGSGHLKLRHKRDSMASGKNRGQKGYLLASPQYASVPDPRQNEKNNRGKKPLLH